MTVVFHLEVRKQQLNNIHPHLKSILVLLKAVLAICLSPILNGRKKPSRKQLLDPSSLYIELDAFLTSP